MMDFTTEIHLNTIELDFVLDDNCSATRQEILDHILSVGLTYRIITENGPAGGNPLLELSG